MAEMVPTWPVKFSVAADPSNMTFCSATRLRPGVTGAATISRGPPVAVL